MKKKSLINLVCVAVLSQYGLTAVTTLAAEKENVVTEPSNSEELKTNNILEDIPMSSTENKEEAAAESEVDAVEATTNSTTEETAEIVEAKTLNWEFKNPQQVLTAGDDFAVKIKGTQATAKLELPEGIEYDAEKNVEELRPLISFDKEKHELKLTKIDEYEEIELVLTVEKTGDYELQLSDEVNKKMSDKLIFTVAEKSEESTEVKKETEKKESKKQTRAGQDSRVGMDISSDPASEINSASQRVLYTTTISHTDSTKSLNKGKIVITIENGKFKDYPKASDYTTLKSSTLSPEGKTITLELKDGFASGDFESYSYSAYSSVGTIENAEVKVVNTFTGESDSFTNVKEKVLPIKSTSVNPVAPGTSSWYLSQSAASNSIYPGGKLNTYYGLTNREQNEGFENLRIKFHFSNKDKIEWFKSIKTTYNLYFQGGGSEYKNIDPATIEEVDDETFIWNVGELNPIDISKLYPNLEVNAPDEAQPGEQFTLTITYMDEDTDILSGIYDYTVEADETMVNFNSKYDGRGNQLLPNQKFLSSYNFEGKVSKALTDLTVTVDVPDSVLPKRVLNGWLEKNRTIQKVEYFDGTNWQEVPVNEDENFDLPDTEIKKIKLHYLEVKDKFTCYQPFRIEWSVKESVSSGTNFKLIHAIEYTDYAGVKQTPDVSSEDLAYEVKDDIIPIETKTSVYQYNKTGDFDKGTVSTGDTFKMNYRIGAEQGEVKKPYIFVKLPKGIKVNNVHNTIQYPYANDIRYNLSPSYGTTVTPISKANNTGTFEAADGSIVYYYKADDTSLTREDYLQMLFIENEYIVENIKSGVYEIEVGIGSLAENYDDATLGSGFATASLSAEMKTKLDSTAMTYYSKKTKLTVGKIDKVTTSVAVKGSEDAAWLDSSKTGKVVPGKKVSYRVSIKNEGTEDYSNVQLVNILPYVGDNLVSSPTARGSQFQINPDSGGVSVNYNGGAASGVTLEYAMSNNPIRFSSPSGTTIGTDPWTGTVSDFSLVRAIRVSAPFVTLKPGDEITLEYSGVVVLDAQRPQTPGDFFVANNSVAYRFETNEGVIRAGEPAVSKVATTQAEEDGLISGNVYIDLDKNGNKAGIEPGLNQVQFELFKKNSSNKFVSTGLTSESSSNSSGDSGIFGFTDLEYGTYKVKVTLPSSKGAEFITGGTDGVDKINDTTAWVQKSGVSEFTINDSSGTSHEIKDLSVPLYVATPLTGTISFKNKEGNVVTSDYGKGFKVELYKDGESAQIAETAAKANGAYAFEDLSIDSTAKYKVKITIPSGKNFVFTTDNSAGEITIDMEPGLGTTDPTDLFITDTDMPSASIALDNGRGIGNDVNPDSVTLTASDKTTSISTDWKITKGGTTEYSGTSTDGLISLEDEINYLIGDKKAGDYTVEMTVTDFAGNQTSVMKNFSIKFANVKYMVDSTEHAKEENLLLYVDKLTKPATDPTKEGYVFDKWVKSSDKSEWNFSTGEISEENLILEAAFKAAEQTIRFDINGGETSSKPADIEADTGDTVDLSKVKEPRRTGYTFKHWYKKGDAAKADVGATVTMPVGGMTLVAEWDANSYKVTFNANDGTGAMGDQDFKYDAAQNLTANSFTREGYSFQGWATDKGGSKKYDDKQNVKNLSDKKDGSVTLYAVWQATEQTITFDLNGGDSTKPADIKQATNTDVDLSTVSSPTRTGYTFKHWYRQGDSAKAPVSGSIKMPAGGMTLVAEWEANDYKVIFDSNKGTGSMSEQSFKYGTAQNLTVNSFTRAGYSFQGWSTDKEGAYIYLDGASVNNLTADKNGTVALYAIWQAENQVLQFDVNGGALSSKPSNIIGNTDSTIDLSSVTAPTRTGYTFKHWYKQGDAAKEDVGTSVKMPATGLTLVAEWEANSYTVKFHSNTGTGTMASQSFKYDEVKKLTKNSFTKDGYTFIGWATAANAPSSYTDEASVSNLTANAGDTFNLYALWSASAQVIQFDVNGGDASSKPANIIGETDEILNLSGVAAPTRKGYVFKHWYKKGDTAKTDVGNSVTMPANGLTLVAEWEANPYKVKFHANGGTETMVDQVFIYDKDQTLAGNKFKRTGYTFAGWSTTATGTATYADKATVSNLTDKANAVFELFAVWTADNQTIQFDINGGTATSKPDDIVAGTDSSVDLTKVTAPTRKGYAFNHWYKQGDAAKAPVSGTIMMPIGGLILVADWTANDYKVTFDANGGTGTMADQDFVYDTEQKLTTNTFLQMNYDFAGWSTTKTGKIEFTDEEVVKNLTGEKDGNKTLYAIWKIQERVISFDVNDGDLTTQPKDIKKGIGESVNLDVVTAPMREGYSFSHWYDKADAAKTVISGTIQMPENNLMLVAAWNANHYKVKFDANGGTGTMKDQAFIYDTPQELTENAFERKNYNFVGWSTEKDGIVAHYDKATVNNLTAKDSDTLTLYAIWEKKPAIPVLKANSIVLTTDQVEEFLKDNTLERKIAELSDAKVVDENTNDVIATYEKINVDISNVKDKKGVYQATLSYETKARSTLDSKEIEVTVIEATKTQKITFDVNGGDEKSKPTDISAKVGTTVSLKDIKAPTRLGYSFIGWFNDETKVGDTVEMPNNGMTLVAHWSLSGNNDSSSNGNGATGGNTDSSTGSGVTNTNILARTGSTTTGKSLPQTNDTSTIGTSIVGGMLALLALFGFKKKKDEESEPESK